MNRRHFVFAVLAAPLFAFPAFAAAPQLEVFKSPTCGCCSAWIEHMASAGFAVEARNAGQRALWELKKRSGITHELSACHTAFVEGYVVEGHVPASDVRRLLAERPDALGLAVPGMPIGSPGMEMGNRRDAFDTLLIKRGGETEIFSSHPR